MSSPAGMEVPEGGSSCAKCEYYDPAADTPHGTCGNPNFVKWHVKHPGPPPGEETPTEERYADDGNPPEWIPLPPTRYCCNWYDWDERPGKESDDE